MATYDIYFSGEVLEGQDPALVRQRIGRMFKAQDAALDRPFSGTPVRIKAGLGQETAIKFRVAFRDAGATVDIRRAGQPPAAAPAPAEKPAAPPPRPAAPAAPPEPPPDAEAEGNAEGEAAASGEAEAGGGAAAVEGEAEGGVSGQIKMGL